jgi:hypothetical protein
MRSHIRRDHDALRWIISQEIQLASPRSSRQFMASQRALWMVARYFAGWTVREELIFNRDSLARTYLSNFKSAASYICHPDYWEYPCVPGERFRTSLCSTWIY